MSADGLVHASAVLIGQGGVLIRGTAGSGKSSLALALLADDGASLVADDQVLLAAAHGRLVAATPDGIAGLIEVRGQPIARLPWVSPVVVDLVVDLAPREACPRLPLADDEAHATVAGIVLPRAFVAIGSADGARRVAVALAGIARQPVDIA